VTLRGDNSWEDDQSYQRGQLSKPPQAIQEGQTYSTGQSQPAFSRNDLDYLSPFSPYVSEPVAPIVMDRYIRDESNRRENFWVCGPGTGNTDAAGQGQSQAIPKKQRSSTKTSHSKTGSNRNRNRESRSTDEKGNGITEIVKGSSSRKRKDRERHATESGVEERDATATRRERR
jgi:hypothetical protein